ncbi:MAG TPA: DUF305 domain-containing protein [Micromonosporaceae bacterium]|nr:DUF305 domain-containing protein [Micromonosporaceae bacterium]
MGESRRRLTLVAVAALAVGVLLGFGVGWLVPRLTAPGDDSAEAGFARDMSSHHAQAVEMALLAYRNGENPGVRQLGYDIATVQQAQIGVMQTWLRDWGLSPTGSRPRMAWMPDGQQSLENGLMPGMATPQQLEQLRNAKGRDFDVLFCQLMLRHHLGGIHMVDGVLSETSDGEVRGLAEGMKAGQTKEVKILQDLLTDLNAKPL